MSDMDKQLARALAENGVFDPGRAATIKRDTVRDFGAKLRKVERYLWIYLAICTCVGIFAFRMFDRSSNTKEQIFFAIVFLVAFESTILIKLWYWVFNTKIGVLKEIKLLRLAQPSGRDQGEIRTTEAVRAALPRWERAGWFLLLIASALIVPNLLMPGIDAFKSEHLCETYLTLEADGSGIAVTRMEFCNRSGMPMMSLPFNAPAIADIRWLDDQGRPMTATAVRKNDRNQYDIELTKPLMPGERLAYTRITKSPSFAMKHDDGHWVYRFDESYGREENDFAVHIVLPEEAESVSLQTEGQMEQASRMEQRVFVNGRRGRNDPFRFTVEYRLPAKAVVESRAAKPAIEPSATE